MGKGVGNGTDEKGHWDREYGGVGGPLGIENMVLWVNQWGLSVWLMDRCVCVWRWVVTLGCRSTYFMALDGFFWSRACGIQQCVDQ